jgi:malic enzyme
MAKKIERPIIFPLSNPTSRSEAEPADLIEWTEGRALVATGSPFAPVKYRGRSIDIAQCNNVFIFPAVGLGLLASKAHRVSDRMMMAAAKALGDQSPALKDPAASLLPNVATLRDIAREVAYAVAARQTMRDWLQSLAQRKAAKQSPKANGLRSTQCTRCDWIRIVALQGKRRRGANIDARE